MNSDVESNESQLDSHSDDSSDNQAEETQDVETLVSPDPGTILCAAREARQLNRAQVGQRLGLTETAVKSLERNRFDYFPSGVYARGYLKNYAKFMELNVNELADMHDQYCQENALDAGKTHLKPASKSASESSTRIKITLTIAIAIIFVASFFLITTSA